MPDIDQKTVEAIKAGVSDMARAIRDNIMDAMPSSIAGLQEPNDADFVAFIEMKASTDPLWLLTRPFVVGGAQLLERYERLTGLRGPNDPPIPKMQPYEVKR